MERVFFPKTIFPKTNIDTFLKSDRTSDKIRKIDTILGLHQVRFTFKLNQMANYQLHSLLLKDCLTFWRQ